jgi:hypothetical protein
MALTVPRVDWSAIAAQAQPEAYRRTWLARSLVELVEDRQYRGFAELYRQLDPETFARHPKATPREWYMETLQYCADRFPIIDPENFYAVQEEEYGPFGYIPIEACGFDPYNDPFESPSLAICICIRPWFDDPFGNDVKRGTKDFANLLRDARLPFGTNDKPRARPVRPPRGREFVPPWDGLKTLYEMTYGHTGFDFLDNYEYFDMMPPMWNVEEIRALERQWAKAEPFARRAWALRNLVDDEPDKYARTLALALLGDKETLRRITKPAHPTPLAEILK